MTGLSLPRSTRWVYETRSRKHELWPCGVRVLVLVLAVQNDAAYCHNRSMTTPPCGTVTV